jgi:hypothetical protein
MKSVKICIWQAFHDDPFALAALSSSSLISSGVSCKSFVITPAATVFPPSLIANLYPTRIGRG